MLEYHAMISPVLRSGIRTVGLISVTSLITIYISAWSKLNFGRSPLLVFNIWFVTVLYLYRIWRKYYNDVNVALFHLIIYVASKLIRFKDEYLTIPDVGEDDMTKSENRKIVRSTVVFLMVQSCMMPTVHFAWLHSLLAYKFLLDATYFIGQEFQSRRLGNYEEIRNHGNRVAARELSWPVKALIQCGKGAFGIWVLFYQTFYVNVWYVLTTVAYFFLTQNCLERPFTRALEIGQLDTFEGLEQFYVIGFLGVVEILFAIFFMLWSLVQHQQFLMLAALYTNVYTGGREVISNAVSTAFAEWALINHFERATGDELKDLDDICAVCLCKMYKARKTPCKHFFHGHCLRRCLKERSSCPICNKRFGF